MGGMQRLDCSPFTSCAKLFCNGVCTHDPKAVRLPLQVGRACIFSFSTVIHKYYIAKQKVVVTVVPYV